MTSSNEQLCFLAVGFSRNVAFRSSVVKNSGSWLLPPRDHHLYPLRRALAAGLKNQHAIRALARTTGLSFDLHDPGGAGAGPMVDVMQPPGIADPGVPSPLRPDFCVLWFLSLLGACAAVLGASLVLAFRGLFPKHVAIRISRLGKGRGPHRIHVAHQGSKPGLAVRDRRHQRRAPSRRCRCGEGPAPRRPPRVRHVAHRIRQSGDAKLRHGSGMASEGARLLGDSSGGGSRRSDNDGGAFRRQTRSLRSSLTG